jgi:hypothetical protein
MLLLNHKYLMWVHACFNVQQCQGLPDLTASPSILIVASSIMFLVFCLRQLYYVLCHAYATLSNHN